MKTIQYIDKLKFTHKGVECKDAQGAWTKAHFQQGDLDGACGVYATIISLMINGYLSKEDVGLDTEYDRRHSLDKFLSLMFEQQGLLRNGYSGICLKRDIASYCPDLKVERQVVTESKDTFEMIYNHLQNDIPVIVSIYYGGEWGHYLVAIGAEINNGLIEKIFCLDPSEAAPVSRPWNGYLSRKSKKDKIPFWYTTETQKSSVKIEDLISIEY